MGLLDMALITEARVAAGMTLKEPSLLTAIRAKHTSKFAGLSRIMVTVPDS
jgi:hypothetical protein